MESTTKVEVRNDNKEVHYDETHMILVLKFIDDTGSFLYRRIKLRYELVQDKSSNIRVIFDRKKYGSRHIASSDFLRKVMAISNQSIDTATGIGDCKNEALTAIAKSKSVSPPKTPVSTPPPPMRK